jgi:hypothetical protein
MANAMSIVTFRLVSSLSIDCIVRAAPLERFALEFGIPNFHRLRKYQESGPATKQHVPTSVIISSCLHS